MSGREHQTYTVDVFENNLTLQYLNVHDIKLTTKTSMS